MRDSFTCVTVVTILLSWPACHVTTFITPPLRSGDHVCDVSVRLLPHGPDTDKDDI